MTQNPVPTEHVEQSMLLQWVNEHVEQWPELRLFYHIPNEGKRSPVAALRLKREGMKKGVPDNCLPVARGGYHGLFIELKRVRGGRVSDEQKQWIADLGAQGYKAVVCKGWQIAAFEIMHYMEGVT